MALRILDIFKMDIFENAILETGKENEYNEIVWINVMEILDVIDSLQKGELLITTGFELDDEKKYKGLIRKLKSKGLAGIGIQPGYYIDDIPKYIIEEGIEEAFPIIRIPKRITFSHITRTIYKELMTFKTDSNGGNEILLDIIEGNTNSNLMDIIQSKVGEFNSQNNIYLCMLDISHKENGLVIRTDLDLASTKLREFFEASNLEYYIEPSRGSFLFLIKATVENGIGRISLALERLIGQLHHQNLNLTYYISISRKVESCDSLRKRYNEVNELKEFVRRIDLSSCVLRYEQHELLKLFDNKNNIKIIGEIYDNKISKITKNDIDTNGELFNTLRQYLVNNCNITQTANDLFIHRHTLRYRLNRIETLCDIDFDDYKSRLLYGLAIIYRDSFEKGRL
jgi:hypothetical protein